MGQHRHHEDEVEVVPRPGRTATGAERRAAPRVLLFPVDQADAERLAHALTEEGCEASVAPADADAVELLHYVDPDIVLIEVAAGRPAGLDLLRVLRGRSDVPIVVVSSTNAELDAVLALELGADDFVAHPVRHRELLARMRAVLRRSPPAASAGPRPATPSLQGGDICVDVDSHEVTVRGEALHLPLREFEILALLIEHRGRVLTRDTMFRRIWGPNFSGDPKTLDVHIKRLREKLEPDPANPARIVTVRGVGYKFVSSG
ncbi:MAG: response regulator transcription factor [Acidimicrobiales bacterium]|nr:response regulator transcription factor [Acidimicrobiales bacterium]